MRTLFDVTSVGEVLVDLVSTRPGELSRAPAFLKCAGGAAANVAVGVAKLGARSAFAGSVGNDAFGKFLCRELRRARVDVRGVRFDKKLKTRIALVSVRRSGGRDFEFPENRCADTALTLRQIDLDRVASSRIVHLSSFLLLGEPARSTVLALADVLKKFSFDPNLRLSLWKSPARARDLNRKMIRKCSILRLNSAEAMFLTGARTASAAARELEKMGPPLVVVTLGARGCLVRANGSAQSIPGFPVRAVDTTGCGDAFMAALLTGIIRTPGELYGICRFANAAGALTATKPGAALPDGAEVKKFLNSRRNL